MDTWNKQIWECYETLEAKWRNCEGAKQHDFRCEKWDFLNRRLKKPA